jgi:phage terminase Nu1 subunit (DNA packaging protein)
VGLTLLSVKRRKTKIAKSPARIVSAETLAVFLNLMKQRVHQLVAEGLPRKLRGKYDLDECARFYIRYLQAAIEKKAIPLEAGVMATEQQERVRSMRAIADLREIELAEKRGHLVAIDDVERELTELVATTKARIMSVPARLAGELLGETSRTMAQAKIEKALKETLAQLASRGGTK